MGSPDENLSNATVAWRPGAGATAGTTPRARPAETAFAATVAQSDAPAAAPTAPAAATAAPAATTVAARTTVLPRVALVGARPTLVREDRLRYEQVDRLGQGVMGEVVKTRDNDIGRLVALKRLRPEVRDTGAVVRFVDEIRTIGQLEHPNIVPIHDVGVDEQGDHYFVMKFVDGETLESIIHQLAEGDPEYHRRYPFERRIELFGQICEAIHYAHSHGIIHRDLKPANVMVGRYGEVVVMDWGLAKKIHGADVAVEPAPEATAPPAGADGDVARTAAGALLGTPAYMAPEQARAQPADERSDVYSLCVLLYELLALRHYLGDKKTWAEVLAGVISVVPPMPSRVKSPHQPLVPMDLSWFVKKGMAKLPEDRYQSVAEMLERLARRREGVIPIQCHVTFIKRVNGEWNRFVDRHPVVVTIGLSLAVLGLIGLGVRALM
ncbi:MAG TPA: serine/threonine-protein kinase [Polyangia bacterium]|jgi:serine/threonine-protein kinase